MEGFETLIKTIYEKAIINKNNKNNKKKKKNIKKNLKKSSPLLKCFNFQAGLTYKKNKQLIFFPFYIRDQHDTQYDYQISLKMVKKKILIRFYNSGVFLKQVSFTTKSVYRMVMKNNFILFFLNKPPNTRIRTKNDYLQTNNFLKYFSPLKGILLDFWILKPVFYFEFDKTFEENEAFIYELKNRLLPQKKFDIKFLKDNELNFEKQNWFLIEKEFNENINQLSYEVYFSIMVLISNRKILLNQINPKFLKTIKNYCTKNKDLVLLTLDKLNETNNSFKSFERCFNYYYFNYKNKKIEVFYEKKSLNKMKTYKLYISPNNYYFCNFLEDNSNRILRKYALEIDNFLRITFANDKFDKIFFSDPSYEPFLKEVERIIIEGINIYNKKFHFLNYSTSQLREHSFWMTTSKYLDLFDKLGDFSKEKNVSKNAARRGQCLSTTIEVLIPKFLVKIQDICYKDYVFTDGIGKISLDLAQICAKSMKYKYCSAIQIRIGGAKGVLAVNPNLPENTIEIRDSMIKFDSPDKKLEVIKAAGYSLGFLNREIIMLLSTLNVEDNKIIKLQDNMLENLNSLHNENKNQFSDLGIISREFNLKNIFHLLFKIHYSVNDDLFLNGILYATHLNHLKNLKEKAKIYVPNSVRLIGTVDETNTLKENEIFLQIAPYSCRKITYESLFNKETKKKKEIQTIIGDVLVTKNPCLHPGDIRILQAVECEKLCHMVNVIVFSAKGTRPVPSMISGGDLDGDEYFASWYSDIFPPKNKRNPKPGDYQNISELKPKIVEKVTIKDIAEFFVNYLKNDLIGTISNRHLAIADFSIDKAYDKDCISLSELQSRAVDFPKHGVPVTMEEIEGIYPEKWPSYLKKTKKNNESESVISILFNKALCSFKENKDEFKNKLIKIYLIIKLILMKIFL